MCSVHCAVYTVQSQVEWNILSPTNKFRNEKWNFIPFCCLLSLMNNAAKRHVAKYPCDQLDLRSSGRAVTWSRLERRLPSLLPILFHSFRLNNNTHRPSLCPVDEYFVEGRKWSPVKSLLDARRCKRHRQPSRLSRLAMNALHSPFHCGSYVRFSVLRLSADIFICKINMILLPENGNPLPTPVDYITLLSSRTEPTERTQRSIQKSI